MKHYSGCMICGEDLTYSSSYSTYQCAYCELEFRSGTVCINGHYICDDCHAEDTSGIIKKTCFTSKTTNPQELAVKIMQHPSTSMHGPEHHFLVPAVLLTAYANKQNLGSKLKKWIFTAEQRASNVLGGFCGFYGACGAAIGTGIFMSIIENTSPLSVREWASANFVTASSLNAIACNGGPRCCKRDTYIAINQAVNYLKLHKNITLDLPDDFLCNFSMFNKQCTKKSCQFFNQKQAVKNEN